MTVWSGTYLEKYKLLNPVQFQCGFRKHRQYYRSPCVHRNIFVREAFIHVAGLFDLKKVYDTI